MDKTYQMEKKLEQLEKDLDHAREAMIVSAISGVESTFLVCSEAHRRASDAYYGLRYGKESYIINSRKKN